MDQNRIKDKLENPEKPSQAGEADILAEAERNPEQTLAKKPTNIKPGQRFYILNGQPQFIGLQTTYTQPVAPQSYVPQVVMRSAVPDDQNVLYFQPQTEFQQSNLKLRNSGVGAQNQEVYSPQNVVFLKNFPDQPEDKQNVRPIRYHGTEFNKKVAAQQAQQPIIPQYPQNYPQQVFFERFLPQGSDFRSSGQLQTLYQTHYVPIGVVPPQESNIRQYTIQNQEAQEANQQQVQFVQIPVNKDVQLPQYIKTVVPLTVDPNLKPAQEIKGQNDIVYVEKPQQKISSRFAPTEIQAAEEEKRDPSSEIAALDFVRYINSRQNSDQFSDTVVIDAKTDNENKEEENNNDSEGNKRTN